MKFASSPAGSYYLSSVECVIIDLFVFVFLSTRWYSLRAWSEVVWLQGLFPKILVGMYFPKSSLLHLYHIYAFVTRQRDTRESANWTPDYKEYGEAFTHRGRRNKCTVVTRWHDATEWSTLHDNLRGWSVGTYGDESDCDRGFPTCGKVATAQKLPQKTERGLRISPKSRSISGIQEQRDLRSA